MQGLSGKVVVVTGAGRGLGQATALRLAAAGARIVVNDVDGTAAAATATLVRGAGANAHVSTHDVGDHTAAAAMIAETVATFGGLHALVNNAGILRDALLAKATESDFDAVIRINLKGVFNCTQAAVAAMRAAPAGASGGSIVNISSISYLGNVGQSNYSAAKAGVAGMTRTWALELARHGIRVNAVAPGLMDTEMVQSIPETLRAKMIGAVPLGRLGRPSELADVVAFLLSDASSYMTGQVLHLCGGASVGGF